MTTTSLLPEFQDNETGWGPSGEPSFFQNVPYAPFSKSDKLGKAADWTNTGRQYQSRTQQAVTTAFNVFEEEDEEDFQMVDTKPAYAQKKGYNKYYNKNQGNRRGRGGYNQRGQNQRGRFQVNRNFTYRRTNTMNMMMNKTLPSIEIRPEWGDPVKEIDFMTLTKQQNALAMLPESVEDLTTAGVLEPLNKRYSAISPKNERPLEKNWFAERTFFKVTTSDDPVLRQYIDAPANQEGITVIATDAILAALMTVTRSVYSWDIVVTKTADNKLIIDKRDDSKFDFVTVNENSNDPPTDNDELINTPALLSQEATIINHNFSQQVLDKSAQATSLKFDRANPFVTPGDSTPVASAGYRYRKWKLGDITLIARTEVDCYMPSEGNTAQPNLVNVRALLEYDPRVTGDWRRRYETQRGAVFATEIKNNSHRLARVVAQSHLAGVNSILLGFIARYNPRDNSAHGVVGVQSYGPLDLAGQMVLSLNQLFGSLRYLVMQFSQLEPGKYLAIKDPNKALFKVFQVPADAFQSNDVGMVTFASK